MCLRGEEMWDIRGKIMLKSVKDRYMRESGFCNFFKV